MNWPELLERLAAPFPPVTIQWRAGATNRDKTKAQALPYVDPRDYERRLDELCPGEWAVVFKPWAERIICELTIHGVTRSSTGESSGDDFAPGTSAEAQAFKRACSKFGLGRHLYDIPAQWVGYDKDKRQLTERPRLPKEPARPARSTPTPPANGLRGGPQPKAAQAQPATAPGRPGATRRVSEATTSAPQPAPAPTLDHKRASAMHRELGKLGFKSGEHYEVCRRALERTVSSLTTLSDEEARRCWEYATEEASRRRHQGEQAAAALN
jgi:hypothetical protein